MKILGFVFYSSLLFSSINASAQLCFANATNYSDGTTGPSGTGPFSIINADFNGDGKIDLATINPNSKLVSVLIGNGLGGFGSPTTFSVGLDAWYLTCGDFNGDGKPDLAVPNSSSNNVFILIGNGAGGFSTTTTFPIYYPHNITSADFNNDGKLDLAVANYYDYVSIFIGNGLGNFSTGSVLTIPSQPMGLISADINNDGKMDLITANPNSNNVSVLLGNGAGGFGVPTNFMVGISPWTVVSKDLNNDGNLDLAVSNVNSHNISVLIGNGSGSFSSASNFSVGIGPNFVTIADLNNDGKMDLVASNSGANYISVLLGNGLGSFATAINLAVGTNPQGVLCDDFNNDGYLDIANANAGEDSISVLLSNAPTINITGTNTVCYGGGISLTASGAITYTWSSGSNNPNILVFPNTTTAYTVYATGTNSCTSSASKTITVLPLPTISYTNTPNILCIGQTATINASGALTYTWNTGENTSSFTVNPVSNTTYYLTGTDINGCQNKISVTQSVTTCPSMEEQQMTSITEQRTANIELNVYPNPNNGSFILRIGQKINNGEIILVNSLGQKVHEQKMYVGENSINTQGLTKGLYNCVIIENKIQLGHSKIAIE